MLQKRSSFTGALLLLCTACSQGSSSGEKLASSQSAASAATASDQNGQSDPKSPQATGLVASPNSPAQCGTITPPVTSSPNIPSGAGNSNGGTAVGAASTLNAQSSTSVVDGRSSQAGQLESTALLPYATLTKNPNQGVGNSWLLSLYNYDPCAFEAANGPLTMPKGAKKAEFFVHASTGDGPNAIWLFPGATSIAANDATLARFVALDDNGTVTFGTPSAGTVTLTQGSSGGSGKTFAAGAGNLDATFSVPATSNSYAESLHVDGQFSPAVCSQIQGAPATQAATDKYQDTGSLRSASILALMSGALTGEAPKAAVPTDANPTRTLPQSAAAALVVTTQGTVQRVEASYALPYATLTSNPNAGNNDTYILSLYNYDPCAREAAYGTYAVPPGGIKFEAFVGSESGPGGGQKLLSASQLSTGSKSQLVANAASGCGLTSTLNAATGNIQMTAASAGGSGAFFYSGSGYLSINVQVPAALLPAGANANFAPTASIVGTFVPSACSAEKAGGSTPKQECNDTGSLRQNGLF